MDNYLEQPILHNSFGQEEGGIRNTSSPKTEDAENGSQDTADFIKNISQELEEYGQEDDELNDLNLSFHSARSHSVEDQEEKITIEESAVPDGSATKLEAGCICINIAKEEIEEENLEIIKHKLGDMDNSIDNKLDIGNSLKDTSENEINVKLDIIEEEFKECNQISKPEGDIQEDYELPRSTQLSPIPINNENDFKFLINHEGSDLEFPNDFNADINLESSLGLGELEVGRRHERGNVNMGDISQHSNVTEEQDTFDDLIHQLLNRCASITHTQKYIYIYI